MKKLILILTGLLFSIPALAQQQGHTLTNSSIGAALIPLVNGPNIWTFPDNTKQLFTDDFGTGTLNTTNRWQAPSTGGGGNAVAASNAIGKTILQSGTQASGWSLLQTQLSFFDKNPGYIFYQTNINVIVAGTTGSVQFWGLGTVPAGPTITTTAYCTDCVGFEINTDGKLRAVTWASAGRTVIADLSVRQGIDPVGTAGVSGAFTAGCGCTPQQTDTASHKYIIIFRGDNILWYIENATTGFIQLVAFTTRGSAGPDVNQLPATYVTVNGGSAVSATANIQVNQTTVGDTASNPSTSVANVAGAAVSSLILKASIGHLISAYATCTAQCWLMIFNSATVPGDGAVTSGTASGNLQECIPIASGGIGSLNYAPGPYEFFSVGITAVISSTACSTKTASTVGFIHGITQ